MGGRGQVINRGDSSMYRYKYVDVEDTSWTFLSFSHVTDLDLG